MPGESLAIGQANPTLLSFKRLNAGFLIHRNDHCIFGRVEIERHDIGGLLRKFRISGNTPTTAPRQADSQYPVKGGPIVRRVALE